MLNNELEINNMLIEMNNNINIIDNINIEKDNEIEKLKKELDDKNLIIEILIKQHIKKTEELLLEIQKNIYK